MRLAILALLSAILISPVLAATHVVKVRNFAFDPRDISIEEGDAVRWEWESGTHTTTSGASSNPGDNPGALWDQTINSASLTFTFTFDTAGVFPYFCRFHEFSNMKGSVTVQVVVPVEPVTWGQIKSRFLAGQGVRLPVTTP